MNHFRPQCRSLIPMYSNRTSVSTFASEASLPLQTPQDTHFANDLSAPHVIKNATFASDDSHLDSSANWPVISSLEVELSGTTSIDSDHHTFNDAAASKHDLDTKTPQRASEVFGFLTERRKSVLERNRSTAGAHNLTPLSALPVPGIPPSRNLSVPSSARSTSALTTTPITATNSFNSSPSGSSDTSFAQIHHATLTKLTPMSRSPDNLNILFTPSPSSTIFTPSSAHTNAAQPSKIPRGPRPAPVAGSSRHSMTPSQASLYRQENPSTVSVATAVDATPTALPSRIPKSSSRSAYDPYTPVHKRPHRRTASRASSAMTVTDDDDEENVKPAPPSKTRSRRAQQNEVDKENSPESEVRRTYPKTPGVPRSHSKALLDVRHPHLVNGVEPPSPARSVDLSPVTREMMDDVRKRRQRTREQVRVASGGSGKSRR